MPAPASTSARAHSTHPWRAAYSSGVRPPAGRYTARGSAVTCRCQLFTVERALTSAPRAISSRHHLRLALRRRPTSAPSGRATAPSALTLAPRFSSSPRRVDVAGARHHHQRRLAVRVRRLHIATGLRAASRSAPRCRRPPPRTSASSRSRSSRSPCAPARNQRVDELDVVALHRPVQRRRAIGLGGVHVGALGHRNARAAAGRRSSRPRRADWRPPRLPPASRQCCVRASRAVTAPEHVRVLSPTLSTGTPARSSSVSMQIGERRPVRVLEVLVALDLAAPAATTSVGSGNSLCALLLLMLLPYSRIEWSSTEPSPSGIAASFAEELRERLAVIGLDLHQLLLPRLVVLVVRQRMERIGHADVVVGACC